MIKVGTPLFVRADKHDGFGYFPGIVVRYNATQDEVLVVYEPLPGTTEWSCCSLKFPFTQDYAIRTCSDYPYASLPVFDCQLEDGKYHVFIVRGLGEVVECAVYKRRPPAKTLEKLKRQDDLAVRAAIEEELVTEGEEPVEDYATEDDESVTPETKATTTPVCPRTAPVCPSPPCKPEIYIPTLGGVKIRPLRFTGRNVSSNKRRFKCYDDSGTEDDVEEEGITRVVCVE